MIGRHERGRTTSMRTKIFILIGAGALLFLTINFLFAPSTGDAACGDKSNKSVSKLMDELKTETKRREELKRQYEELEHKVERLTVDLAVARANKGSPAATAVQSTPLIETTPRYPIPIVIFTYNRPQYLERALNSIFSQMPSENFPVIVSQDDQKPEVTALIARMRELHPLIHLQRTNRTLPAHVPQNQAAYYQIAGHYKFALSHVFDTLQYSSVILLEEDIEVAPDFFTYFAALQWLLFTDRSLYCVSAWNDNGLGKLVDDSEAVYRSNFFPGLGWMLTKQLWNELKDKWPAGYWDDWLREPAQRRNRDCIRPEISRTYTFGESGASGGQFYAQHLKPIKLNDRAVDWHNKDLTHLLKDRWTEEFQATLSRAREVSRVSEISGPGDVKVIYRSQSELSDYSRQFGLIDDAKAGVPRTAYDGVLTFKWQGARVFLAPASYA